METIMKKLYLARHAKSSWKNLSLADFDRPLNRRGKVDGAFMGSRLQKFGEVPDLIIASPARRAGKTARMIAAAIGYPKQDIRYEESIYLGGPDQVLDLVRNLDDTVNSVMVVGHNPGLTMLAELLSGSSIGNIPTSGIFCMDCNSAVWQDISSGCGKVVFFDYPKKHRNSTEEPFSAR